MQHSTLLHTQTNIVKSERETLNPKMHTNVNGERNQKYIYRQKQFMNAKEETECFRKNDKNETVGLQKRN